MRKNKKIVQQRDFSILTLDDDRLITETLQSYLQGVGYHVDIENDPIRAVEKLRETKYDILLLDFLMDPIRGDEVVRRVREFDEELFIILLTGHKSMAPPIKTIRELDIQGYYEKNERFDQLELLIESCTKSIAQMRTIRHYRDGLKRVLEQVPVLNHQESTTALAETVVTQVCELLSSKDAFVFFDFSELGVDTGKNVVFFGSGVYKDSAERAKAYYEKNACTEDEDILTAFLYSDHNRKYGILVTDSCEPMNPDIRQLFDVYAEQAGAVVSSLYLCFMTQLQNKKLIEANEAIRQNYLEMVDAIRKMVDAKDYYTRGHSDRVSFYAVRIAREMGKDEAYIESLKVAGLFHDIGKIRIPDTILRKDGRLTDDEYEQIKKHPGYGRELLSSVSSFRGLLPIIESHHEWYNGKGYPNGTAGSDIPEQARIIGVADAFDAMTSQRTYRDSYTLKQASFELYRGRGTQFDPDIADIFLKILENPYVLERQIWEKCGEMVVFKK